jgi:hypothetical protein
MFPSRVRLTGVFSFGKIEASTDSTQNLTTGLFVFGRRFFRRRFIGESSVRARVGIAGGVPSGPACDMALGRFLLAATGGDGGEEGVHGASRAASSFGYFLAA